MTVEEKAGMYAAKTEADFGFDMHPKTASFQGFIAGYAEAMRWRNPKVELPESNEMVQIEYRHMMRDGNSYSHDRYDPKEQTWNIEEIDNEVKVLYWRPIE